MSDKKNVLGWEGALSELIFEVEATVGEFCLIPAHCNYVGLRERIIGELHEKCKVRIREITLRPLETSLHRTISEGIGSDAPDAVMIKGLESTPHLDQILTASNQIREEFRKSFPFPLILWVNDHVLRRLSIIGPDLKSWAGIPIYFEPSDNEILDALERTVCVLFDESESSSETLNIPDLSNPPELKLKH